MPLAESITEKTSGTARMCYHCGTPCINDRIHSGAKLFCCEGCLLVYEILENNGLCNYYQIQNHPGLNQVKPKRQDKFAWLDQPEIAATLYDFTDGNRTVVTLYIPGVHCSSCMWLLEHLQDLESLTSSMAILWV